MGEKRTIAKYRVKPYSLAMTVDLLIDGMMSGTGIRDAINGGYVEPADLGLSRELANDIEHWVGEYGAAHIRGHPVQLVAELDCAGLAILSRVQDELPMRKLGYYSDGRLERLA